MYTHVDSFSVPLHSACKCKNLGLKRQGSRRGGGGEVDTTCMLWILCCKGLYLLICRSAATLVMTITGVTLITVSVGKLRDTLLVFWPPCLTSVF